MKKVIYFENIYSTPAKEGILQRLGYHQKLTQLTQINRQVIDESIQMGLSLCHNKGAYLRSPITYRSQSHIEYLEQSLQSSSLSKLLSKCSEVVLMAVTVGTEITERISKEISEGDVTLGVIMDATASQAADAILDWMMDFLNNSLIKEGKRLTKHRYSPGYGDLPLENQKQIFELMNLHKIGLTLTDTYILIPEKSVLAITGIERIDVNE